MIAGELVSEITGLLESNSTVGLPFASNPTSSKSSGEVFATSSTSSKNSSVPFASSGTGNSIVTVSSTPCSPIGVSDCGTEIVSCVSDCGTGFNDLAFANAELVPPTAALDSSSNFLRVTC